MIFALATNNPEKLKEMDRLLKEHGHKGRSLKRLNINAEIEENGETFEENAIKKAMVIAKIKQMPAIADDSGLMVDALDGAPGVYTARYAGIGGTPDECMAKLLDELKDLPKEKRTAHFVSSVCLYDPRTDKHYVATGVCDGWVGFEKKGKKGFGYDPIFMVGDGEKSFAQMSPREKDSVSHRAKALAQLSDIIATIDFGEGEQDAEEK